MGEKKVLQTHHFLKIMHRTGPHLWEGAHGAFVGAGGDAKGTADYLMHASRRPWLRDVQVPVRWLVRPHKHLPVPLDDIEVGGVLTTPSHAAGRPALRWHVAGLFIHPRHGTRMLVLWHAPTRTMAIGLSGLTRKTMFPGVHLPCNTALVGWNGVLRKWTGRDSVALPQNSKVHKGILQVARDYVQSNTFKAVAASLGEARHVVVTGFSLGGMLTHVLGAVLGEIKPEACKLALVAQGAPRSGNAEWASWFGRATPDFFHLNLVRGRWMEKERRRIQADEVTMMPLTHQGYRTCLPQRVIVHPPPGQEGEPEVRQLQALEEGNIWNLKGGLCLGAMRFTRGIHSQHKLALLLTK